jgi:hypothetical protein
MKADTTPVSLYDASQLTCTSEPGKHRVVGSQISALYKWWPTLFNIYNKSFRDTRQIYLYSTMASQVISPKALAHVVLRTSPDKLKEMREFYLQLLGAKVSYENDWACFMTYDFEHHRIAVIAMPGIETKRIAASPGLEVNDGS